MTPLDPRPWPRLAVASSPPRPPTREPERRPPADLWDAASGRFDPSRLRTAMVGRGWTVADFVQVSAVSRSCLYKALHGISVSDRTAIRVLTALRSRRPELLDE